MAVMCAVTMIYTVPYLLQTASQIIGMQSFGNDQDEWYERVTFSHAPVQVGLAERSHSISYTYGKAIMQAAAVTEDVALNGKTTYELYFDTDRVDNLHALFGSSENPMAFPPAYVLSDFGGSPLCDNPWRGDCLELDCSAGPFIASSSCGYASLISVGPVSSFGFGSTHSLLSTGMDKAAKWGRRQGFSETEALLYWSMPTEGCTGRCLLSRLTVDSGRRFVVTTGILLGEPCH